ncbi:MAG: hypothetical protein JST92_27485 [Deltaproteobacteria bacterium]|nr:hypothetical protein [Deltaproteobacteria bacterium]
MQHITEAEEDEAKKSGEHLGSKRKFDEFECPTCSAYNPHEAFGNGEDVHCAYCGLPFVAEVDDEGRLKLREH